MQVLCSRYKCGTDLIPRMHAKSNSSFTWKSICATWPLVVNNLGWRLGNGSSVSFWKDTWIPTCGQLLDHAISQVPNNILYDEVNNVTAPSGGWNWNLITTMLPAHICGKIAAIPPPSEVLGSDILIWVPSCDGNFSVKAAYNAIAHPDNATSDPLYQLIWKCSGLERIKLFLWLTSYDY